MANAIIATDADRFDVIPYTDLSPESTWTRLGKGSFGCVFKGTYLGLDVAIKEVLNSEEYDVDKYFRREATFLKECRHPNIVQFIGLSLAPYPPEYPPSAAQPSSSPPHRRRRVLIISEYLPNGNLRSHITNKHFNFSWRLRLSFAIDITRALTYLHARNCLHRDLKGENLLITENNRIKVCDFGFARLAARNEEEMRRMSYCGTDGYMSPEILLGEEFGLETDIFSLGVIFCEIAARKLVDDYTFTRSLPTFGIDTSEIRDKALPDCPPAFLELAIACVSVERCQRPKVRQVLDTLSGIEADLIKAEASKTSSKNNQCNIGSLKFGARHSGRVSSNWSSKGGGSRHSTGRIPSFQGQGSTINYSHHAVEEDDGQNASDEDLDEMLLELEKLQVGAKKEKGSLFYLSPENNRATSNLVHVDDDPAIAEETMDDLAYSVVKGSRITRHGESVLASFKDVSTFFGNLTTGPGLPTVAQAYTDSMLTVRCIPNVDAGPHTSDAENAVTVHEDSVVINTADRKGSEEGGATGDSETERGGARSDSGVTTRPAITAEIPTISDSSVDLHEAALQLKYSTIKSFSLPIPASPESRGSNQSLTFSPHRFTLIKPGWKVLWESNTNSNHSPDSNQDHELVRIGVKTESIDSKRAVKAKHDSGGLGGILPAQLAGLLRRCQLCEKRLGLLKPYLACDDCQHVYHVPCGDLVYADCQ